MTGIQARRRKAAKKKARARNSKTTAASIETSTSQPLTNSRPVSCITTPAFPEPFDLGEFDSSYDIDDALPEDITRPDGRTVRVEYYSASSADPTECDYPVGPPDSETVGKKSSGEFYYYLPHNPDKTCLLISWHIIPGTPPPSYWIGETRVLS